MHQPLEDAFKASDKKFDECALFIIFDRFQPIILEWFERNCVIQVPRGSTYALKYGFWHTPIGQDPVWNEVPIKAIDIHEIGIYCVDYPDNKREATHFYRAFPEAEAYSV